MTFLPCAEEASHFFIHILKQGAVCLFSCGNRYIEEAPGPYFGSPASFYGTGGIAGGGRSTRTGGGGRAAPPFGAVPGRGGKTEPYGSALPPPAGNGSEGRGCLPTSLPGRVLCPPSSYTTVRHTDTMEKCYTSSIPPHIVPISGGLQRTSDLELWCSMQESPNTRLISLPHSIDKHLEIQAISSLPFCQYLLECFLLSAFMSADQASSEVERRREGCRERGKR